MIQNKPFPVIAVDGGAASGKSSTSRALAERFGLLHVDTGSHYRVLTYLFLQRGLSPEDVDAVRAVLAGSQSLGTRVEGRKALLSVNGTVPADADIRTEAVNATVSRFAAIPEVRSFLMGYQRSLVEVAIGGGFAGLIMEGRDIGSVIFPNASLKVFLEADPETRSRRRALEGQADSIAGRDSLDQNRKTAPLKCVDGALRIDSSHMTLAEVVDAISIHIQPLVRL